MQETNLYTITLPSVLKGLKALRKLLDKATTHVESKNLSWAKFEHALLADHMIFDQFPLVKQIQVACDTGKGMAARLAQIEIPKHEDNEKTIPELQARIDKTIAFIETIKPEQIIGKENITITISYFPGKYMTGFEYVTEYALPNFYFHVCTAYNLLRKNGVKIGKDDYLGGLPLKDI